MILSFADQGTEDIFNGVNSASARRVCPRANWKVVFRKLDQLDFATKLLDLRIPSGNSPEIEKGSTPYELTIRIESASFGKKQVLRP